MATLRNDTLLNINLLLVKFYRQSIVGGMPILVLCPDESHVVFLAR